MTDGSERQAEVVSARIERLDQSDFLGSPPLFDLLFTRNCGADAGMWLEPNELGDVVFLREAGKNFCFVLADTLSQVTGYAEIEDAGFARHEIDMEGAFHCGGLGHR